jgi:hypothetical protein
MPTNGKSDEKAAAAKKPAPIYTTVGTQTDKIDIRLSYKIVRLFSEGLYASSNKAIEELVANAFDAGAQRVAVFMPADFHAQGGTIAVLDDGEGMDNAGLKRHWLIGKSMKRELDELPRGRQQIGKFGIGKLATYVLANRLTHISKSHGKFYATSMDYRVVDERGDQEIEAKAPVTIGLRELSAEQAAEALKDWTETQAFKNTGIKLFGTGAAKSWTFAILSDLKEKVLEIRPGRLEWVLRTAMPLRDDFEVYLRGTRLESSKAEKGRIKRWTIGKEIVDLPKPASDEVETVEDKEQKPDTELRYSLRHPKVGLVRGYAEIYRDPLGGGKSDLVGRSNGFFVYVLGRLINPDDGHFGISANELRHGTFSRMRVAVHMDGLDDFLQSDREHFQEGTVLEDARNILRAIFNWIRPKLESEDAGEDAGAKLSRKLGASPTSLARRPIIDMARAALDGKVKSRYIALPPATTQSERETFIAAMETRAETPELFISGIDFVSDRTADDGIAVYDAATARLRINQIHPFIGAFFDQFVSDASGLPLEVFAMSEVLLESQLHQAGLKQDQIDSVMTGRDQLLRYVASTSGRVTPLSIANSLRDSRNDQDKLEQWVVEAFRALGFETSRVGKSGNPDGVAEAVLGPDSNKQPRRYKVSLEAKSKEKPGTTVSAKTVGVATIARQRKKFNCEHAIVVGQQFPTSMKDKSALGQEIAEDRRLTKKDGAPRTITLITIDDLANLVQQQPVKALTLPRIRSMLEECSLPEECKVWIDKLMAEKPVKHDYAAILKTIAKLEAGNRAEPVQYGELRAELRHLTPKIDYPDIGELREVCKRMAGLAPDDVFASESTVELQQSVPNIIAKIATATKAHLADKS